MIDDVMDLLACPHCGAGLTRAGTSARCSNCHVFDVARQGYLNLLAPGVHTGTADTAAMVDARVRFLAAGHYTLVSELVAAAAEAAPQSWSGPSGSGGPGAIVDIGSGPGYYLARACEHTGRVGVALDISKFAARRSAKAHPRIGAVVADAWGRLPLKDSTAAVVLDIFSPRNPAEFHRILQPRGIAIVVVPDGGHLAELIGPLGLLNVGADKLEGLDARMGSWFERVSSRHVASSMALTREEVSTVVGMGPSAWHADERLVPAIERLPEPVDVTLSVHVVSYRRT